MEPLVDILPQNIDTIVIKIPNLEVIPPVIDNSVILRFYFYFFCSKNFTFPVKIINLFVKDISLLIKHKL